MRILYITGREISYPRNDVILNAFLRLGEVDTVTGGETGSLIFRLVSVFARALPYSLKRNYDLIFIGFIGQPLVLLLRFLTRKPILFDAFLSVYDTLCFERRRFSPSSLMGRITFWLDRTSCFLANMICLDTQVHAQYFHATFGIPSEKLRSLFVGSNEALFYPRSVENTIPLVLYYGSFLPLHGIDVIVRAAKILEDEPVLRFRIIGKGIETERIKDLTERLKIKNIDFLLPIPLQDLPDHISQATVCLGGHFGSAAKAGRVIAGKTFQCMAMGKATIVGDNPANRELLTHGYDAWFCRMNDPEALAEAIRTLIHNRDLCKNLGEHALQTFMKRASIQALSEPLQEMVETLVGRY